MNEHIESGIDLVRILKHKHKFIINDGELDCYREFTCEKMRSAAQFQINKIGKLDQSTKDIIVGCSKVSD